VANRINLYLSNVEVGKNLKTYGLISLDIHPKSSVKIGNNVQFVSSKRRYGASLYSPVRLKTYYSTCEIAIGDGVGLNGTVVTCRSQKIVIGENTIIAGNVTIVDSDFHNPWPPEKRLDFTGSQSDKEVIIENNVWIGIGTVVLKGVTIGKNSVIGSGSIVTSSIPSNVLAGGIPAKVIKVIGEALSGVNHPDKRAKGNQN
jgi:acetyltransferase-like isoleucine patch superfamily enzyme